MTDKAPEPTATPNTPPENSPHSIHAETEDDYSKYLLYSRAEILFVLRALLQKGAMITVYFDNGNAFLLTALNQITKGGQLIFDMGSDQEMNQKALVAEKLIFISSLDKVKIQFSLKGLRSTSFEGRPAFLGELPETLLRLQRREYYRLVAPIANPIKCLIPADPPMEAPILDISGGGIGLMLPMDQKERFAPGTTFPNCCFALPEEGEIETTLTVRNAFPVTTKTGNVYLRAGCEYVDLPGTRLSMVQRYITRIERERKARLSGLD